MVSKSRPASTPRRPQVKRRKLREMVSFEVIPSGPFCAIPPHFFDRSLELARAGSERQPGIVVENLRFGRATH